MPRHITIRPVLTRSDIVREINRGKYPLSGATEEELAAIDDLRNRMQQEKYEQRLRYLLSKYKSAPDSLTAEEKFQLEDAKYGIGQLLEDIRIKQPDVTAEDLRDEYRVGSILVMEEQGTPTELGTRIIEYMLKRFLK